MAFGIRNRKKWHEMTRGDIVAALIGCTVIGGLVIARPVYLMATWPEWNARMLLWPAPAIVFVVAVLGAAYVQAFRELKRRRNGA